MRTPFYIINILLIFSFDSIAQDGNIILDGKGYEFDFKDNYDFEPPYIYKSYTEGCTDIDDRDNVFILDRTTKNQLVLSYNGSHQASQGMMFGFLDETSFNFESINLSNERNQTIHIDLESDVDGQITFLFGDRNTIHPDHEWHLRADMIPAV